MQKSVDRSPPEVSGAGQAFAVFTSICLASLLAPAHSASAQVPAFRHGGESTISTAVSFTTALADFDRNGFVDVFVGMNGQPNKLFINESGRLRDVAVERGVADSRPTRAAAWGDFDNDGLPDLLVGFAPGDGSVLKLYRNVGQRFTDVTEASGLSRDKGAVRQPVFVDIDGDGNLELFIAFRDGPNALFRQVNGKFVDVASSLGLADARKTVGAVWFDFDEDGDLDLYTANMDGDANALFRNDGARFVDVAEVHGVAWGGRAPADKTNGTVRPCVADVNGDGRLDLFTANYGPMGLFLNTGKGNFRDVSNEWGVAIDGRYDSCAFADMDNDGVLDLYVNGTVTGGTSYRDYLFKGRGDRFEDVTPDSIKAQEGDHGVQWADIDRDGNVDLLLNGSAVTGMQMYWRNTGGQSAGRSLQVNVERVGGAAGAELRVYRAGTRTLLATRVVDSGSGYDAQNGSYVHLGVPVRDTRVDVEVILPRRGQRTPVVRRGVATHLSEPATSAQGSNRAPQPVVTMNLPR